MTTAKDAVTVLLLQAHVLDGLKAVNADDRDTTAALMDVGDKKTADIGGVPLGKVELRAGGTAVQVADRAALLAWVAENRPDVLTQPVDTKPLAGALYSASDRGWVTEEELQVLVGAAYQHLGVLMRTGNSPRLSPAAEKALLDNVKDHGGMWVDEQTGEAVELPGVVFTRLDPKVVVTPDRKNGAPAHVMQLLEGGTLPAMPAVEA